MRIIFLTDIHANLEALEAVLYQARRTGYDKLVILGDLVGYGPDPIAVIDIVSELIQSGAVCIKGNHDEAACIGPKGMNDNARISINWTQSQLHPPYVAFLAGLPMSIHDEDRHYVHASADKPQHWHYITSVERAELCLDSTDARLVFVGHTHIPAVFHALPGRPPSYFKPQRDVPVPLSGLRRAVTVVGSVGQPRDDVAAACFGLLDTDQQTITMKRVAYDHSETADKIRKAGLPFWLGDRLAMGV
jgi:diadenosine tetraphosphatase ApaH/serine/threonine PP2A family protein phosphatase